MRSKVAEDVRQDLHRQMMAMTASERMALALAIGERDLCLFAEARGLTTDEALSQIRIERQTGRRFSRSKAGR
jgi:hypothetical protein